MMNFVTSLSPFATLWADALLRGALDATIVLPLTWLVTLPVGRRPGVAVWFWRAALLKILLSMAGVGIGLVRFTAAQTAGGAEVAADPVALLVVCLSLFGIAVQVKRYASQAAAVARVRRFSTPLTQIVDPGLLTTLKQAARRAGLRRFPAVLVSEEGYGPMLTGALQPVIVLPKQACGSPRSVTLMGLHELAHVARQDLFWGWLLALVETLLFFHPLVYLARRELLLAQEMACDQAVVAIDRTLAGSYARLLLETSDQIGTPAMALGMTVAGRGLERRLLALQNTSHPKGRFGLVPALLPSIFALCVVPYTLLGSLSAAPSPGMAPSVAPYYPAAAAIVEPVRTPAGLAAPSGAGARQPTYRARAPLAKVRASRFEPIAQGQ